MSGSRGHHRAMAAISGGMIQSPILTYFFANSVQDDIDVEDVSEHDLIIAETVTLVSEETSTFNQSITPDVHTDFSFFVSHANGVFYISLESWIRKLETELSQPQTEGSDFRLKRVLESANSSVEQYLQRRPSNDETQQEVTAVVVIEDGNVGYLVLTTIDGEPQAALLDAPEDNLPTEEELAEYMAVAGPHKQVREAWQPPKELYEPFDLLSAINIPARRRATLQEEIRLSPATLELLVDVHRALSVQTSKIQHAASDLFNRATRLQEEFRDQVYRSSQIASHIDKVTGNDEANLEDSTTFGNAKIDERLERVKARQDEINARYESLRRKMASLGQESLVRRRLLGSMSFQPWTVPLMLLVAPSLMMWMVARSRYGNASRN